MKDIKRKHNLIVNLLKFTFITFNKKILSGVVALDCN